MDLSRDLPELTFGNLIPELVRVVPEFNPEEADLRESITYLVFDQLVEFLFELEPTTQASVLQRAYGFLERAATSPDREVQMLLRDVAWALAGKWNFGAQKHFVGPQLMKFVKESPAGEHL